MNTEIQEYLNIDYEDKYKEQVLAAIDQGYKDIGYSGIEPETLDKDLNKISELYSHPSCFKLIFAGEDLIACYAIKVDKQNAELKRVYVKESYRGQGLAKALSLEAFDYVKNLGIKDLNIWSGTLCHAAHNLYQKLGAQKTDKTRELGGKDQVIEYHFIKKLN